MAPKPPKAFHYPLSHQDKTGFIVGVQTEHGEGEKVNRMGEKTDSEQEEQEMKTNKQC